MPLRERNSARSRRFRGAHVEPGTNRAGSPIGRRERADKMGGIVHESPGEPLRAGRQRVVGSEVARR